MIKELNKIVAELNQHLNTKDLELDSKANPKFREQLEKCRDEVEEFKASIKLATYTPETKNEVLYNYKREADRLKLKIDKINR